MHNICVRIYVRLYHISSCSGPPIELPLVASGLTPILLTSKIDSTVNNTYVHVKTVYQTHRNLHRCQDRDKYKAMPLNIKSIHRNITGLQKVTPLNIKIIQSKYQRPTLIPKY